MNEGQKGIKKRKIMIRASKLENNQKKKETAGQIDRQIKRHIDRETNT